MNVENKKMYHIHTSNKYDDIWTIGNEITIDDNFLSYFYESLLNFTGRVPVIGGGEESFASVIKGYLKHNLDNETYIKLLKEASNMLSKFQMSRRELVLENYRKKFFPNLPSRKNSIWLCDEKSLEFWKSKLELNNTKKLFEVSATGNLFESSDNLLPDDNSSINEGFSQCERYWNPEKDKIDETCREYLFQGKIKILRKIDINNN